MFSCVRIVCVRAFVRAHLSLYSYTMFMYVLCASFCSPQYLLHNLKYLFEDPEDLPIEGGSSAGEGCSSSSSSSSASGAKSSLQGQAITT